MSRRASDGAEKCPQNRVERNDTDFGAASGRAIAVRLPPTGDAAGAVVTGWLLEPGEFIEQGESLVEVLVPGVTIDVPAPIAGRLVAVVCPADTRVRANDILGWIEP